MSDSEREQLERVIHQQHQMLMRADHAIGRANAIFRQWPLQLIVMYLSGMVAGAALMRDWMLQ